ncbi:PKD domain-containing protein [Flavobacterium sp. j3]|uniref:PKD domain-containing protein n=1 Tax=Flavobacterium aureirubrum TaxID=3133147 RepID=A0ABU9N8F7_9FLAO
MKHSYLLFLILLLQNLGLANEKKIALLPSATITGATTVCQNAASPLITFTGSGGTAPYTFTYTVTGVVGNQTISTTGTNNSVTVAVPTGTAGTFTYTLVSVADSLAPSNPVNVTGSEVVTINPQPNANMGGTGSGSTFGVFPVFRVCSNTASTLTFTNTSTTTAINTNYTINWGDGSPNFTGTTWTSLTHTYQIGLWFLTYTINANSGCSITRTFVVFVGSNPAVSLGNPGNTDICNSNSLTFPITGTTNNPPGTTYTVTFNDNSTPQVFNHPPPASVTHLFTSSSCGTTSSDGSNSYPNSFSANIVATNPCSTSSVGVVPIYVSANPQANFNSPPTACLNTQVCLTNTSQGNQVISNSCSSPSIVWSISPSTGFSIASGILGNDFSSTDYSLWLSGSDNLCLVFNTPGIYTITMKTGNKCGVDTEIKTICVQSTVTPQFTLNTTTGCTPVSVTATNNTNLANQCATPTYLWAVTHTPAFCGTTIPTIPNQTTQNASYNFTEPGTYLIRLTVTNSCGSTTTTQTVTVKKPPTVAITNIADFCQSVSLTPIVNVSPCTNTTPTYLWSFPGGTPSSATSQTAPSVTYAIAGNYTVSLAVTNECGTATAVSNSFAVQSAPTVQNETITVCGGVAFSVSPSNSTAGNTIPVGTTYSWPIPIVTGGMTGGVSGTNQTVISGTLNNSTSSVQTATYTITPKIGTCSGATFTVIVTVNPAAQVNQPIDVSVCNGATTSAVNFTTTNPSGTTFSWTNSTPSIGLAASGNGNVPSFIAVNTTNSPILATIIVTPSFSGGSATCSGVPKTFTITVNPTGEVNQPSNLIKCNGEVVSIPFSTSNSGGTTIYNWTNDTVAIGLAATGTGNISFTATNSTSTPLVATINVIPTYNNGSSICTGTSKTFTITINPSAQVNQPPSISVCNGNIVPTTTFSTLNTSGTTSYTWTNSNTAIGLSATGTGDIPAFTAINTGNSVLTATIIVTPSYLVGATSCTGSTKQFTITVSPNANVNATTDKIICNGSSLPSISFSSANTGGTTSYSWTNDTPSIGLIASGTGNIPTFMAVNTGLVPVTATISVTPSFTNGSLVCSGVTQTFTITVNPSAQVNSINNIEVCNGNSIPSIVFSTNNPGGITTYSWTNSNISIGLAASGNGNIPTFTANNTGSTPLIATITVTPTYTNTGVNCGGISQTFTITVNPSPTGLISGTVDVCLNASNPLITFTGSAGNPPYIFTYTINNGSNQTISTTSGNSISINAPTNVLGIFTYNLINVQDSNATSCLNTISQSATVTVTAAPLIDVPPTPTQSICVGGTIQNPLTVTYINGTGTPTYQWYSNTSSSTTGGTAVGTNSPSYLPSVYTVSGTYYYYVIISFSGSGCGSVTSAVAEIVVVSDPIVSTQPIATQSLCQNETPTNLTVTVSGGIGTISYQWFRTTTSTNIGGTPVGTNSSSFTPPTNSVGTFYYYCSITQSGVACSVNSNSVTVIINTSPTIVNQPSSSTVCQNGTPTTLFFTYSNGVGTPTYQWYSNSLNSNTGGSIIPNETNPTYIPPSTTTGIFYYYCVITFPDLIGSCSSVTTNVAIVTINPQSTIDIQPLPTQSICVGGTIQNPLTVTYINGTGTPTYQWYSNTSSSTTGGTAVGTNSPSYLPPVYTVSGTYYYYVIISFSGSGCGSVTSAVAEIVVVSDPIVSTQPIATQTLCQNATASALTVVASGGIGTYSYQWYSNTSNSTSGGTLINGAVTDTYTPSTSNAGTIYYYCEITQPNGIGCNVSSEISEVNVNIAPIILNNPSSSTVCLGNNPTLLSVSYLNGVGTPNYQWYSNTSSANTGGTLISGATNATYNPPATSTGTTFYYCEVTFSAISGSCSLIVSNPAEVTINPNPVIAPETTTICSSTTFTITPNTASGNIIPLGTTYTWSNPTISPAGSITGASAQNTPQTNISQTLVNSTTSPATVTYTVTPISGVCTGDNFTVTVTINPAINPNVVTNNNTCFGVNTASITTNITGGIPPYTINWTGPNGFTAATTSIANLLPGLYNVTIDDLGGCPFSNSYTIIEPADIVITVDSESDSTCFGSNNGSINISITGGTGDYFYTWTKDNIPFATTQDVSGLAPGAYEVSVTDANNCGPKTATFTITEPPLLVVSLVSQTNVLCFGAATGAITVNIVGGTPNPSALDYTYAWTGPNGFISSNQNLNSIIAGTYNLSVTDDQGCSKNLTVVITQSSEIIVNFTTTPITCFGANNASITATISGGNAPYQFQWNNLATTLNQTNLSAGTYTITVTDNVGCSKVQNIIIPEAPLFTVNPIVTNVTCFGANNGSINLNLTGGIAPVALTWSDGSTAGLIRNNLPPGTYTATISDGTPCFIVRTFTIIQPQALVLAATTTNPLDCNTANNGSINLIVSGGTSPFTYTWSNGATTEDLSNLNAGNYFVTVTDSNNCVITGQYNLVRPAPIQIAVTTQTDFDCATREVTQNFVAQASGGIPPYQYQWSSGTVSGANNQIMNSTVNGTVILTVTDSASCTANYTVDVDNPVIGNASFEATSFGYATYGIYSIGDPIQFNSTITGDYLSVRWDFGDGTFSTELNPVHTYQIPRDYIVTQTVTYPFGCIYVQTISLVVEKGYLLVVPTAFTPNRDTLNDTYRPVTKRLKDVQLDIYDTWGSLIYSEKGDVLIGWDGTIKGFNAENGNYYSKVKAETFYGTIVNENQTFVLIK